MCKGGAEAPRFVQKEVAVKREETARNTVVLRASTHRQLVRNLDAVQKNPGLAVRRWIHETKWCNATQIGDTWGWNQSGAIISGVMRVDVRVAPALLKLSGQRHAQNRWFFEPLRFADPVPKPFNLLPETCWMREPGASLEHNAAACEKQAVINGLGVRLGSTHVGVRQVPSQCDAPRPRTWKATNVPRFLDVEDFQLLMEKAGFDQCEPLEKFRWRQHTGYVFKAIRASQCSVWWPCHFCLCAWPQVSSASNCQPASWWEACALSQCAKRWPSWSHGPNGLSCCNRGKRGRNRVYVVWPSRCLHGRLGRSSGCAKKAAECFSPKRPCQKAETHWQYPQGFQRDCQSWQWWLLVLGP